MQAANTNRPVPALPHSLITMTCYDYSLTLACGWELSTNFERSVIKRREIVHYKVARFQRDRGFKRSLAARQKLVYMRIVRLVNPDFAKILLDTKPVS